MPLREAFRVLLMVLVALVPSAVARGQVLADTFSDGIPGNYWTKESTNASLEIVERNGRLEFTAQPNTFLFDLRTAGYAARGWQLAPNAEIRARIGYRAFPTGTSNVATSAAGVAFQLYSPGSTPLPSGIRPGVSVSLGEIRNADQTSYRTFDVRRYWSFGGETELLSVFAFPWSPTVFYFPNLSFATEVPIQSTLYVRYIPNQDLLFLSSSSFFAPDAVQIPNARGVIGFPVQFGLGGYGRFPGTLTGSETWCDNFVVEAGQLETAPQNLVATDGTQTDKVRLTWGAAAGITGYVVRRSDLPSPLVALPPSAVSYDDLSAVPGTIYEYTVESATNSGFPLAATDGGWRNHPAPTGLVASAGTSTEAVMLNWSPVTDAIGYRVFRRTGSGTPAVIGTPTDVSFSDTTATPGILYTYTVTASLPIGDTTPSVPANGWRNLLPPTNVAATSGSVATGVNLTWTAASGATGYTVRRAVGDATPVQIGQTTATSFSDTTATAGIVYTYTVASRSAAGDSGPSEPAAGWRSLPAPTNVQASDGTSADDVTLTWNAASGAGGYRVYRALGGNAPIAIGETSETSLDDLGAEPGVTYGYTVRILMTAGEGIASAANSGWRNVPAPTGLVASDGASVANVTLMWEPVPHAIGYRVLRGTGSAAPTAILASTTVNSFTDSTAAPGALFRYAVRAYTAPGNSDASVSDTGWRDVPAVANLAATDGTVTTGVNLSWTPVTGGTSYRVLRAIAPATPVQVGSVTGGTYSDTTAAIGATYTYSIQVVVAAGTSNSPPATETGWRGLPAPTGVAATDGTLTDGVDVSWNAVVGATGYSIYRGVGNATPSLVGDSSSTGFSDVTVPAGTVFNYTVRAMTPSGPSPSSIANSGWRNIAAPTGLVASDGSLSTGVGLTWDPVPGALGYRVLRGTGPSVPVSVIASPNTNSFLDATAAPGTTFTYAVRAYTAAGDSATGSTDTGWRNVATPSNLAATDGTLTTGINVTWTAVAGATGYKVYRALGATAPTVEFATASGASFADTSVAAGTIYTYAVKAVTASGLTPPSNADTGWRNLPAPIGVAASDGTSSDGVTLTWTAVPGAVNYEIVRVLGADQQVYLFGGTTFVDALAQPGLVYSYRVRAMTAAGASASSLADSGWRNLPAPTGLTATDGTLVTGVSLGWNAVPGTSGYRVFRAVGTATPTQVAQLPANASTYLDTSAAAGTTFTYTVRAFTTPGNSAASAPETGWRNVNPPTNLAATDGTLSTGVQVTWTASPGASGYRVFRGEGDATPAEIATPAASPYLDTSAVPGVVYTYSAKARTASGDSIGTSNSNTGFRTMPAPTGVAAGDGTATDGVPVAWNAVTGATQYLVFRSGTSGPVATVASTSVLDIPPAVGTVYTYTVKATNAPGSLVSAASAGDAGWRNVPAPTGVTASDGSLTNGVTVGWTPLVPSGGVTGYRVFRAAGTAAAVQVGSVATGASSFLDASAVAGTAYAYSVRAATAAGLSATSGSDGGWRDVNPPATMVASDGTSTTQVTLSWPAVTGAIGYLVYRLDSPDSQPVLFPSPTAAFNDLTATPGQAFVYQVAAQTAAGLSLRRSPLNEGWRNVPAPTNVNASDGTSLSTVTVSWNAVEHATGYRVYRGAGSAAPTTQVSELDAATTQFVDAAVTPGSLYTYAVKAKVAAPGDSVASLANTGFAGVAPPTALLASDGTSTSGVSLNWTGISPTTGLTGYRIYRSGTTAAIATVGFSTLTFTDTAATAGQSFTYTVKSVFAAGESLNSPTDGGWRNLPAPTNLQASDGLLCGRVRVTWNPVTNPNVTGYSLYRAIGGTAPVEIAIIPQATSPAYEDIAPPIPLGQAAYYAVAARMAPGQTSPSVSNTGFPENCLTGDEPTGGHGGDLWAGLPGRDRAPDGEEKDGNAPSAGTGMGDTGTGAPPAGQTVDGSSPESIVTPDCKEVCERIRGLAAELDRDPTLATKGLVDGLLALLPDPDDQDQTGSDACRILAGDLTLDGRVDGSDLNAFLFAWALWDLVLGDLNRDGLIDDLDLTLISRRVEESDPPDDGVE